MNVLWEGHYVTKIVDGKFIAVVPLLFGRARIIISDGQFYNDSW